MDKDFLKGAGITAVVIGLGSLLNKPNIKRNPTINDEIEHIFLRANDLISEKTGYRGGRYKAGIIHPDYAHSIFAAVIAYNYEDDEIIFFEDREKDDALVADKSFLKTKKLKRVKRDISRPDEKGVYEKQRIRGHDGKPIYSNKLIEKYGFIPVIDTYTEKYNDGGGDNTAMAVFKRGSYSDKITIKLLTDMKELYIIEYNTKSKEIVSYEIRDYFEEHNLPKGTRVKNTALKNNPSPIKYYKLTDADIKLAIDAMLEEYLDEEKLNKHTNIDSFFDAIGDITGVDMVEAYSGSNVFNITGSPGSSARKKSIEKYARQMIKSADGHETRF